MGRAMKVWELLASLEPIPACFLRVYVWFNGYFSFLLMVAAFGGICFR